MIFIKPKNNKAFSLIEVLIALTIASMALIAVFTIYDRASRASESIMHKLDQYTIPAEILQKIAEDLDRIASPGSNARITVSNAFQNGLSTGKLSILSQILDKDKNAKTLEKVVWLTEFDMATGRLILYRSHSGLIWEDNLLDKAQRADWSPDRELFVPLCTGVSYFRIQIPESQDLSNKAIALSGRTDLLEQIRGTEQSEEQKFLDSWNQTQLPAAITISISFAAPVETKGTSGVEVPDDQKIVRTVVIDRSKKLNFKYISPPEVNGIPDDANSAKNEDAKQQDAKQQESSSDNSIDGQQSISGQQPSDNVPFRRNRTRSGAQPIHEQ